MKKPTLYLFLSLLAILVFISCQPERKHRGITDENQRTHVDSVMLVNLLQVLTMIF